MAKVTPQDAFNFMVEYYESKGFRLQPNDKNILVKKWQDFVNSKKASPSTKPVESSRKFGGFTTGDTPPSSKTEESEINNEE